MTDSGKPDRWNSLLETLGIPVAERPPEKAPSETTGEGAATDDAGQTHPPRSRPQTISALPPPKAKPAPKSKPAAPQAKSPSYWSRIAGALGLEVPPEPEPAPAPEPSPAAEAVQPATPPRPTREPEPEPWGRRDAPAPTSLDDLFGEAPEEGDIFRTKGDEPAPPAAWEPAPRTRDAEADAPRGRHRRGARRRGEDRQEPLEYDVESDDLTLGEEEIEAGPRSEPRGERDEDRPRRRRRRGRGRGRRGESETRTEPRSGAAPRRDEPLPAEEGEFGYVADDELDSDLEQPLARQPRGGDEEDDLFRPVGGEARRATRDEESDREGGPRRRRRRRRGGRGEGAPRREEPGTAYEPDDEESEVDFAPRPTSSRPPRHGDRRSEREPALERDVHEELEEGHGEAHLTHKKIPTWQEAVSILVDANMAARTNGPDRERGRGRRR